MKCVLQHQRVTDSPALGPSDTVEITDQSCLLSFYQTTRHSSTVRFPLSFPVLDKQKHREKHRKTDRTVVSEMERSKETVRRGKRGIESGEGKERAIGCVFML